MSTSCEQDLFRLASTKTHCVIIHELAQVWRHLLHESRDEGVRVAVVGREEKRSAELGKGIQVRRMVSLVEGDPAQIRDEHQRSGQGSEVGEEWDVPLLVTVLTDHLEEGAV